MVPRNSITITTSRPRSLRGRSPSNVGGGQSSWARQDLFCAVVLALVKGLSDKRSHHRLPAGSSFRGPQGLFCLPTINTAHIEHSVAGRSMQESKHGQPRAHHRVVPVHELIVSRVFSQPNARRSTMCHPTTTTTTTVEAATTITRTTPYSSSNYRDSCEGAHHFVVEVHEMVVDRVLRRVLSVASEDLLHVAGVAPAPGSGVHARNVVQDERLHREKKQNSFVGHGVRFRQHFCRLKKNKYSSTSSTYICILKYFCDSDIMFSNSTVWSLEHDVQTVTLHATYVLVITFRATWNIRLLIFMKATELSPHGGQGGGVSS